MAAAIVLTGLSPLAGRHAANAQESGAATGDTSAPDSQPAGSTRVASLALDGTSAGSSSNEDLSGDGRYVAFWSSSNDVVRRVHGRHLYRYDRRRGQTEQIDQAADGGSAGARGFNAVLSANGRYAAFTTTSPRVAPGDDNRDQDVYWRDMRTGESRLVSKGADGHSGNSNSYLGDISADGRYVVFWSFASDLVEGDGNRTGDVFLFDTRSGENVLVSRGVNGNAANNWSLSSAISADGQYVAFYSYASDLVDDDPDQFGDVFLFDVESGSRTLISRTPDGGGVHGDSLNATISADGALVAYQSTASDLVQGDDANDDDVFLFSVATGQTELISHTPDGGFPNGPAYSVFPSISDDGSTVVFKSNANDLIDGHGTNTSAIFGFDPASGEVTLVSQTPDGDFPNDVSLSPASPSSDGRLVSFTSYATDLVQENVRPFGNAYVYKRR